MASEENFTIQGRLVGLPVVIRDARSWAATFVVDAQAAQALIAPSGLEIAEMRPGKAIASIAAVRYEDGDLDRYNEVAVAFVVRRHDAPRASAAGRALEVARNKTGVYIHHLPVDQGFTLEAGRTIWGYPKFMAEIEIDEQPKETTISLKHEGTHVLRLTVRDGIKPWPRVPNLPTYTFMGGVLRRTPWETFPEGTRGRLGGATLQLGRHPIADELRSLALPKRALMSTTVAHVRARFGASEIVTPARAALR
ncbi:MAG TPA: acetoacetate decarboxylase family protein [Actinomycetota bacterium]|nr:acetoacetate decarboxylase family protein [Actinomycetota bacterium]